MNGDIDPELEKHIREQAKKATDKEIEKEEKGKQGEN